MTNLRKERMKLGLSMSEVSRRSGVPFRTWQKWELGHRRTPEMAFKLLKGIESNIY
jgi:DNA-binding transcriptional regulator YiaG